MKGPFRVFLPMIGVPDGGMCRHNLHSSLPGRCAVWSHGTTSSTSSSNFPHLYCILTQKPHTHMVTYILLPPYIPYIIKKMICKHHNCQQLSPGHTIIYLYCAQNKTSIFNHPLLPILNLGQYPIQIHPPPPFE